MKYMKLIYLQDVINLIEKSPINGWVKDALIGDVRALPSAQPYTEDEIQKMQDLEQAELDKAFELGKQAAQTERMSVNLQVEKLSKHQSDFSDLNIQSEQRWIPVSERLPEEGVSVLISVGGVYSAEGCLRWDKDWNQFRWSAIQDKEVVDAWMPLPEPFKEEQE